MAVDLESAVRRIGDLHFPMQMASRSASPQTMVEMLSDLEVAVQNAKALAAKAAAFNVDDTVQ